MKQFAQLYAELDETTRTNEKVAAMARYFQTAPPEDAAWAIHFLIGRRPKRLVKTTLLHQLATEMAEIPAWLFTESYDAVGDLAETITLLLPESPERGNERPLHDWVESRLLPLAAMEDAERIEALRAAWTALDRSERFVFNKLITGAFRVGVSQDLVVRALSQVGGVPAAAVAHRLMGDWAPTADFYRELFTPDTSGADPSRPYPFCLAHPLDQPLESLGDVTEWSVEWKWDGIRAQVIRRGGQTFIWSRGEELITDRFPEVVALAESLPDGTVLDGEILAWQGERPLKFAELQRRIGRKTLSKKILQEVPVVLVAFDVLEIEGVDVRAVSLSERRARLEALGSQGIPNLVLSPPITASTWEELAELRTQSRANNAEGFMLKRCDGPYGVGRRKGGWWKWKVDPLTVDAVVIYAQRGSGKRASLYTDYTFGIWNDAGELVPFAKAYSGLSDAEIAKVDAWVRRNTREKFGPVRTVNPELVMELAFEGIQESTRHKSGLAVRFPRIVRWRHDKKPEHADSVARVREMLHAL